MPKEFKRDVLYDNLKDQQRNDSYQPNKETNMINLDTTFASIQAYHNRLSKINQSIARDRVERDAKAAKTDSQESQEPEATQEQRTDAQQKMDEAQDEYLASRGLKTYPKLDQACKDYLSRRGLSSSYDSANSFSSNF